MLPETMNTIEIDTYGGPEVLNPGTRALPEPGEHQVLVKIAGIGVNGPDIVQRRGHYMPPEGASDLLGLEVSGEVVAVGAAVSTWKAGDMICALTHGGGYAEYVAIDANHCLPVPENVDLVDAAGLPETYFTVWSNFFLNSLPESGNLFLVHGGAGGIGSTAVQLGSALGLRVFTTCGSAEKQTFCEALGAERAINYKNEDFVEIVRAAGGANLILDILGGDVIANNIKAASLDARIIQLAFNQGAKVELNLMPLMLKRLTLTGSTLRSRPPEFKAKVAAGLTKHAWPLFATGKLKSVTHTVLPLSKAKEAHTMMEASAHTGKILLTPEATA